MAIKQNINILVCYGEPYTCPYCDQTFPNDSYLGNHFRKDHRRTFSALCSSDESLAIPKGRLSCIELYDKLDLDSSRKADVIRSAVDRVEVLVAGSERALSSTV
ncbi:hypothetical protein LPJ78_000777 [Coemansia sp. RSA 989]|nr:hypothetical protein LPJ79_000448 [Coemansia sp. RSA 1821]KAJ1867725.1 hypothetical protein LPJ78_000777 [Coemansia sp. RSA 989]